MLKSTWRTSLTNDEVRKKRKQATMRAEYELELLSLVTESRPPSPFDRCKIGRDRSGKRSWGLRRAQAERGRCSDGVATHGVPLIAASPHLAQPPRFVLAARNPRALLLRATTLTMNLKMGTLVLTGALSEKEIYIPLERFHYFHTYDIFEEK